jgi:Prolipoprotein diacylglyceryl transferase
MRAGATKSLSRNLDKLVRVEVLVLHRSWPAFQVCGCTGVGLAVVLAMALVVHEGLSRWVMTAIVLSAVVTFFGVVMLTKVITGEEQIVYYHHEIAVLAVAALLLWLLHQPILPYLDITLLGVGTFLVCGRVGCLLVGCCHGQPCTWGICYREEHAAAGFPAYLVGVRLFPVQAVESAWVLNIVIVGAVLALRGYPPGTALTWYVVNYCLARFSLEFMRGDPERAYFWGFSEAQWTSLLLVFGMIGAELAGLLPFYEWHAGAAIALLCSVAVVVLRRSLQSAPNHRLLLPHHIAEVAEVIEALSEIESVSNGTRWRRSALVPVHIGCTSLGVQVSGGQFNSAEGCTYHYALSNRAGTMNQDAARALARLILFLRRAPGRNGIVRGSHGVYHLLIPCSNQVAR